MHLFIYSLLCVFFLFVSEKGENNTLVICDRSVLDWIVFVANSHEMSLDDVLLSRPQVEKNLERLAEFENHKIVCLF